MCIANEGVISKMKIVRVSINCVAVTLILIAFYSYNNETKINSLASTDKKLQSSLLIPNETRSVSEVPLPRENKTNSAEALPMNDKSYNNETKINSLESTGKKPQSSFSLPNETLSVSEIPMARKNKTDSVETLPMDEYEVIRQKRLSHLRKWCKILGYPSGHLGHFLSRTAVIPELNLSYCQVAKTSSTSITNQLLDALAKRNRSDVAKAVKQCEVSGSNYCNYHVLLRKGLGYGFKGKYATIKIALNIMKTIKYNILFVRHPLEKFFAGARAHYNSK